MPASEKTTVSTTRTTRATLMVQKNRDVINIMGASNTAGTLSKGLTTGTVWTPTAGMTKPEWTPATQNRRDASKSRYANMSRNIGNSRVDTVGYKEMSSIFADQ
jgi:hypothetical protein